MKRFEIIKYDARRVGYPHYKYEILILYPVNNYPLFYKIKEWSWENWGASKEIHDWVLDYDTKDAVCQNKSWSWESSKYIRKIYLRDSEELSYFKLVWGHE